MVCLLIDFGLMDDCSTKASGKTPEVVLFLP